MQPIHRFSTSRRIPTAMLMIVLALMVSACGGSPAPTNTPTITPISVQFSWVHTIEYAGFYLAQQDGAYAAENLSVEFRPATFDADGNLTDTMDEVVSGRADFGTIGSDVLMRARQAGQPVVAVAAIYQRLPLLLITMPDSGITRPEDLIGKTVSLLGNAPAYWDAFFRNANIDQTAVNILERTDFSTDPLVNRTVDAMDAYLTNQPVALAQQGIEVNRILLSDYAIEGYPNVIFTTEATIQNRPDQVERFLRATISGYQRAVQETDGATNAVLAYNSDLDAESEQASMELSIRLIVPPNNQIGTMSEDIWRINYELLRDGGLLPADFDYASAYNLTFLNRIYPTQTGG
jgi:NitT/TauT family transport system substrate-binding protein